MADRNDLPSPTAPNFNQRVRETLMTYLGRQGNGLDQGLTLRDLIDANVIKFKDGFSSGSGGGSGSGGSALPIEPISGDPTPDLTPPPTATGLTVSAGLNTIFVEHNVPTYTQGHGHGRTHLFGAKYTSGALPTFANATELAQFQGAVYSFPADVNTIWHLWVTWESADGVQGQPGGGTNGVSATTGQDVSLLLTALSQKIAASELATSLSTRIDLIDASGTGLVTKVADLQTTYGNTANSATNAAAAATSASNAAAAQAAALLAQTGAQTAKDQAVTAKTNAETAASNASTSATNAATSATGAAGSAATATTQATNAATSASAAGGSATAAGNSATTAATSATAAGTSATAANTAKVAAESARDAASGSASAAATSASTATTQATAAGTSATTASTAANTATTKAGEASTSATNAATSATNAAGSASTAATSATTAATSATNAGNSASAASTSANTASTKASEAATSASAAATSAINASTSAGNAGVYASNSAASATNAAGSASSAATALTNVQATVRGTSLGLPLAQWTLNGQSMVTISDGKVGTAALRLSGSPGAYPNQGNYIAIDPTKKYRARFWARPVATTTGLLYFTLQQFTDDSGSTGPVNGGRSPYKPSGQSRASHNATYGTDAWGEYSYVWDAADWQSGVKFFRPDFLDNYSGGAGYWEVQDFTLNEVTALEANTAAIQTEATTRATETGQLYAKYTVKVDVAGHVSGFGLASTANNDTPFSSFGIRANQFFLAPPSVSRTTAPTTGLYKGYVWVDTSVTPNVTKYYTGSAWSTSPQVLPFVVNTSPEIINGVTVPAGVYMDAAYIKDGTITNAKIGNATIDSAKIASLSADKITAGSLQVGSYIQSTTYTSGSAGWRINANGSAEFSGVIVRGTVYATAGSIGGNTIDSTSIRSGQTAYNTGSGFYLGSDGKLSLGNSAGNRLTWDGTSLNVVGGGTFSGALSAATGSFAGSLTAATGSFAGSLSAATGSFGTITAAADGSISSGQSGFNSGTGFWLGSVAGTPKFSIGSSSGNRMTWDGSTLAFDNLSATISGSAGSYSVSVTGGVSPYSYIWLTVPVARSPVNPVISSGATSSSVSVQMAYDSGSFFNDYNAMLVCLIKDGNGRSTFATTTITVSVAFTPTCFPAGSLVLMADGTYQAIETIIMGDWLMGWNGPVEVTEIDKPLLGSRKMLSTSDGHYWSDEHAHWTRDNTDSQWWWAYDKPRWLAEVEAGAIGGLFDNSTLRSGGDEVTFAHISGWKTETPAVATQYGPETQLYLPRTNGTPIIVDGYVVGAGVNQYIFDYAQINWDTAPCRKLLKDMKNGLN